MKKLLITDMDNTLFDWFEFWHSSFSAMLSTVSETTGISSEELIGEIRPIHQKHGTSEYAFLLQELPCLLERYGSAEVIMAELDSAIHAYRSARKRALRPYKGVVEALEKVKKSGARVAVYTESRCYHSASRLAHLGLDGVVDVLFSPPDHHVPESQSATRVSDILTKTAFMLTPEGELKPNPDILAEILNHLGCDPHEAVYVGDSEMKDIVMAQQAGVVDVWAQYGNGHFAEADKYELLRAVSHWTDADVAKEKAIKDSQGIVKPSHTIDSFAEILDKFTFGG